MSQPQEAICAKLAWLTERWKKSNNSASVQTWAGTEGWKHSSAMELIFYKWLVSTPVLPGSLICRGICMISLNPAVFWEALKHRLKIGTYFSVVKVFILVNNWWTSLGCCSWTGSSWELSFQCAFTEIADTEENWVLLIWAHFLEESASVGGRYPLHVGLFNTSDSGAFQKKNHYISVAMVYPREYLLFIMVDVIFL